MDSTQVTSEVVVVRRNIAPIGLFLCRLIALCVVYSTPALAHDQGRVAAGSRLRDDRSVQSESLDPKHEKDHDEDREVERGHS
jgi:hypothetical protein